MKKFDPPPTRQRSWIMSLVGSKNTRPEVAVRKIVHAMGCRYRLHCKALPGCPDIVMPKRHRIILVHGCFWHGHGRCSKARIPKTRSAFWAAKMAQNKRRDARNVRKLQVLGWPGSVFRATV
jgi:DNA mismatch endonuclease (patch repair protein)